ncbi:MAG: hypothetical protein GVY30_03630 [Chloroflexi bacterium]|jgi:hypothetical protein|nr:hypothetical protein [Chloroflexota bacterium]
MNAMETNVKVLGWLYIVLGILGVIIGAIVLFVLLGTGIVAQDGEAMAILFIVGVGGAGLMAVLSLPGIVTGVGLLKYQSWARVLAIILGAINLPAFPIGTVLGAYSLIVMLSDETSALFANR